MSDFTYEEKALTQKLETYEWDNVWWEHAPDTQKPRVLYIGDSISCATRRLATAQTNEEIYFDGFGTSKAIDNAYFEDSLRIFACQQGKREIVIFNNGLHGWHLSDDVEYANEYEKKINFLLCEFKNTPIALVLTTFVKDEKRNERVKVRNSVVVNLAKKYNLPIIDLYEVTQKNAQFLWTDGVHWTAEGNELIATTIVKRVKEIIG